MARHAKPAKRANRPNPRIDRNYDDTSPDFHSARAKPRGRYANRAFRSNEEQEPLNMKGRPVELLPRNLAQESYLDTLSDESKAVVFAMGPAGTGKTMLATLFAINEYQAGRCNKIVITRPAVSVDESHGYLPGTLIEKLAPWVVPIMDVFKEVYPVKVVERMLANEIIEISPLAYMRGRTMKDCIVIADEMQNATPSQMKMLLTRIGENSRMIVTGDLRQHDRGFEANGLKDFVARLLMFGSRRIAVCQFDTSDVERHPVIEEILRIYGDD